MYSLPFELVNIIYEYDGRWKNSYSRCVEEINQVGNRWCIITHILEGVILPRQNPRIFFISL